MHMILFIFRKIRTTTRRAIQKRELLNLLPITVACYHRWKKGQKKEDQPILTNQLHGGTFEDRNSHMHRKHSRHSYNHHEPFITHRERLKGRHHQLPHPNNGRRDTNGTHNQKPKKINTYLECRAKTVRVDRQYM